MGCPNCNQCNLGAVFQDWNNYENSVMMRFDEPQQGKFKDCWFVAALSSYLFVNWTPVPTTDTFSFFNGKKWVSIATSGKVCQIQNDIYGAKEIVNNVTYSWPAVYEKAYANFRQDPKHVLNPPDMQTFIDITGNPLTCLEVLSGRIPNGFLTSYFVANEIFMTINDQTRPVTGYSSSVSSPFVAWTAKNPPLNYIKDYHSFSILGTYQPNPASQYIILRDPDLANQHPNSPSIGWDYIDYQTYLTRVNTPDINKGIFAITSADFKANFEGFGYVR